MTAAIIRSPNSGRQDALGRVAYPPVRLSRAGLATGAGAASANRTALQAAITKAITYRTWVVDDLAAGTYDIAAAGASPYDATRDYCLNFGDGTTGFKFLGSGRSIFRVASAQIAGSTRHCDLFIGRNLVDVEIQGRFNGGSLQQAGWTGGYGQDYSCAFFFHATNSDRGIDNLIFRNCYIRNCFGNPVDAGVTANGRRTSDRIEFHNCHAYHVGEGFQTQDNKVTIWKDCHVDNDAGTMAGDFYEPARAEWFELDNCTTYSAQTSSVGSHVDCFGAFAGKVTNCVFQGGNDGIGTQSSSGTVRRVDVENTTFDNLRSVISSCADKTHVVLRDCTIRGCGTVSIPCVQVGVTNVGGTSDVGSVVELDGGHIDASYPIFVTRNGTLKIRNRTAITNALSDAIQISRADSSTPVVDLDVVVRSPAGFGVLVHGQGSAFSPKGRIRGVFSGAVNRRNFSHSSGGTYDQLEVDVTMPEAVQSYLNYFELVGAKESNDPDYDPGVHPGGADIRAGSKGQRVMFRGVSASRTFTNAAAWQLTTSTFTLDTKSSILMEHIGGGVWREVQRWVMA